MDKLDIKNPEVKSYLEYQLEKKVDEINSNDLDRITEITIMGKLLNGKTIDEELLDLKLFKKLKSCMIKDFVIKDSNVEIINSLKDIEIFHFDNCIFKNSKEIEVSVNNLIFTFCDNVALEKWKNVLNTEQIRMVSCKKINYKGINKFQNLRKLYLQSMNIKELNIIDSLPQLEYLNLNGSKVKKEEQLEKLNTKVQIEYKKENLYI